MTTPDLPHLKALAALAEKATPGPWRTDADHSPDDVVIWAGPRGEEAKFLGNVGENDIRRVGVIFDVEADNGRFIAAANPQAILAILARLEAAESVVEAAKNLIAATSRFALPDEIDDLHTAIRCALASAGWLQW